LPLFCFITCSSLPWRRPRLRSVQFKLPSKATVLPGLLYSSTYAPNTSINTWTRVQEGRGGNFSDSGPAYDLLLVTASRWQRKKPAICDSVDFSLDHFRFKWILWLGPIGCRRTLVAAICSSLCLEAHCGRRSVPPKPPFPGCLGGTRLSVHRKDLSASSARNCGLGLPKCLNRALSRQSTPRQRTLPPPPLIFDSSPTHLSHLPKLPKSLDTSLPHFLSSVTPPSLKPRSHPAAMSTNSTRKYPSTIEAKCPECGRMFSRGSELNRHRRTKHPDGTAFKCVWHDAK
jgi:hypothetical protein